LQINQTIALVGFNPNSKQFEKSILLEGNI